MGVEYQDDKRIVVGLLSYEKTMLERLFIVKGPMSICYSECKTFLRKAFRLKERDVIDLIDCLCLMGYLEKIGGKRNLKIKIIKDYWGDDIDAEDKDTKG